MNNKDKIVKKILFEIIDKLSKDADVYKHNGSLWLINTDSIKWVFEFTKSKTLWYNYNFFRTALKFVSLDINERSSQKYITEWFESRYLNINQVKQTLEISNHRMRDDVDDTIQNGFKNTKSYRIHSKRTVEDTIQNGVKNTLQKALIPIPLVEDTIQNGVKETSFLNVDSLFKVEDTIQNGVKYIYPLDISKSFETYETIQNGVKKTDFNMYRDNNAVEDTIKDGVKHTEIGGPFKSLEAESTIQNGVNETKSDEKYISYFRQQRKAENTIENGFKEDMKK